MIKSIGNTFGCYSPCFSLFLTVFNKHSINFDYSFCFWLRRIVMVTDFTIAIIAKRRKNNLLFSMPFREKLIIEEGRSLKMCQLLCFKDPHGETITFWNSENWKIFCFRSHYAILRLKLSVRRKHISQFEIDYNVHWPKFIPERDKTLTIQTYLSVRL